MDAVAGFVGDQGRNEGGLDVARWFRNDGRPGIVFFLVLRLAYGAQPHPVYFLSGWVFAWAFMFAGLPGALMLDGGETSLCSCWARSQRS